MSRMCMLSGLLTISLFFLAASVAQGQTPKRSERPNIVWITCEDMGPHLGCYGDSYARTPNLDKFARRALRYRRVWSNAPVCAPARTTIISGLYPPSTGSEHMRSQTHLPKNFVMFPVLLRRLGYYCTNRVKEDYNLLKTGKVWDDSSKKAHWKNRRPDQPFFAVFNFTITHESQIRNKHKLVSDPAKVRLPSYHPDTPEVRRDWAQYYDRIAEMDQQVGEVLQELEEAGLLENTIVFFFSDHGSGMPRHKRHATDSGLHVPLLIAIPERFRPLAPKDYQPGGQTERLVSFVDLAPTVLSLAGTQAPEYYQGQAFMGKYEAKPRQYVFGFRGRMDGRYDLVRSVRDERYVYVRNYVPHRPHGQHVWYQFQTPTTRIWKQLFDMGKLNREQSLFWQPKGPEELYDLTRDPDEVHNLARAPEQLPVVQRFRQVHRDHVFAIRDVGFLPENEVHSRSKDSSPYEMGHDPKQYPLERIFPMAQLASALEPDAVPKLLAGLQDSDSGVRWWAVQGLLMRGHDTVAAQSKALHKALADPAESVRIAAAEALGIFGSAGDVQQALPVLLKLGNPANNDASVCLLALNALDNMGERAAPAAAAIRSWPTEVQHSSDPRAQAGVPRLIDRIRERLAK